MKRAIFVIFMFLFFIQLNAQIIDERTGIEIYFQIDKNTFPKYWQSKEIAAKGVDLDESEIKRSQEIIHTALCKYPKEVIQKNIKKIYFLKSIEFYGIKYGGTNSTDVVYIANDGVIMGYTDGYIEKSFHHEFSSILFRKYPSFLNKKQWQKINTISYGDGGVIAMKKSNDSQEFDQTLNQKGFLFEYAASSFENDINSFAENLFLPDDEFYEVITKHLKIKEKYLKMILFYQSIDDAFSEAYFLNFD